MKNYFLGGKWVAFYRAEFFEEICVTEQTEIAKV